MRILRLRFKNLNSLYGEHEIDFTKPVFRDTGMFAIVGPTGAGKSTILDAICLALYGQTPRQGSITGGSNEVMSRHTGDCFAEVEFESNGATYVAFWAQHRSRKKADGNLQPYSHTVSDSEGKELNSKERKASDVVYSVLGLNFEQFTRSVLLAQGNFDSFLQAKETEKAEILQRLTATDIYAEISKEVFQRHKKIEQELAMRQDRVQFVTVLSAEERQQVHNKIQEHQQALNSRKKALREKQKRRDVLLRGEQLQLEVGELTSQVQEAERALEQEAESKKQLHNALQAAQISEEFGSYFSLQEKKINAETEIETCKEQEKSNKEEIAAAKTEIEAAQQGFTDSNNLLQALQTKLPQLRELDAEATALRGEVRHTSDRLTEIEDYLKVAEHKKLQQDQKMASLSHELEKLEQWFQEHPECSSLQVHADNWIERIVELTPKAERLTTLDKQIHAGESQIVQEEKAKDAIGEQYETVRQRVAEVDENYAQIESDIEQLLNGSKKADVQNLVQQIRKTIELQREIMSLEERRATLSKGEACPLCGATEHPFAHDIPDVSEEELQLEELSQKLRQIDALEEQQKEVSKESRELTSQLQVLSAETQGIQARIESHRENNARWKQEHTDLQQEIADNTHKLRADFDQYGIQIDLSNPKTAITQLKELRNRAVENIKNRDSLQERIAIEIEVQQQHESVIEDTRKSISALKEKADSTRQKLDSTIEKRNSIESTPDIDALLQNRQQEVDKAQKILSEAKQALATATTNQEHTLERKNKLSMELSSVLEEITATKPLFARALERASFASEQDFLKARLSHDQRTTLANRIDALQTELERKEHNLANAKEQLQLLDVGPNSETQLEELHNEIAAIESTCDELSQTLGELQHRLSADEEHHRKRKQLQQEFMELMNEKEDWNRLNSLVGSSDGAKFNKYVQGITFDILVTYANRHLHNMHGRYVLKRTSAELDLSVVDLHQDSVERPVSSLSGGESFLVSLSLALGLSAMASKNVTIGSLFLDEGFGTLDEESLQLVLQALGNLHHENKLVGIISHVESLKERVPAQILVVPGQRGHSSLVLP